TEYQPVENNKIKPTRQAYSLSNPACPDVEKSLEEGGKANSILINDFHIEDYWMTCGTVFSVASSCTEVQVKATREAQEEMESKALKNEFLFF
ncbi:mCG145026, partial [Mus musculus]